MEAKQAQFLLKEIDNKISSLKTKSIKYERVCSSQAIQKCMELRDVFGKAFVDKMAEEFDGAEIRLNSLQTVEKKGTKGQYIYIVTRGSFIESVHTEKESREMRARGERVVQLTKTEGSILCLQNVFD